MARSPRKAQWWRAARKCGGRCWYCGALPDELTVDHAKPCSRGGKNSDDNLLPACDYCNNLKSDLTVSEFRKFVKVTVIRNLMSIGYITGNLSEVKIVFFGEGNTAPLGY